MKAYYKTKKKRTLLDVTYVGTTGKTRFYQDKDKKVYPEDALDFVEYYGG